MKATPEQQRRLLDLAHADAEMAQLQHLAKNLPEQLHLVKVESERHETRAAAAVAVGALEDAQGELRRLEDDTKVVTDRLASDEQRLHSTSSAKEIAGLESEIAALRNRRDLLDDTSLALMERIETLREEADTATTAMRHVEDAVTDLLARRDAAREGLRQRAREVAERRRIHIDAIPAELVELYESIRGKSGIGAAELRGRVSMATNETLDPSELSRITAMAADELAFDPTTGSILVRNIAPDVD